MAAMGLTLGCTQTPGNHSAATEIPFNASEVCSGRSTPGKWHELSSDVIFTDVDTSMCGFVDTPIYLTSLAGSRHWEVEGATTIVKPSESGFRVYLSWTIRGDAELLATAQRLKWAAQWQAIPKPQSSASCAGTSTPEWSDYGDNGIHAIIATGCGDTVPLYFMSMITPEPQTNRGVTSVYNPSGDQFELYIYKPGLRADTANSEQWAVNWLGASETAPGNDAGHCVGSTDIARDVDNWSLYPDSDRNLSIFVSTAGCDLDRAALYFTSLGGKGGHWATLGVTSIYSATADGFRIYLKNDVGRALTLEDAKKAQLRINWRAQLPTTRTSTGETINRICQDSELSPELGQTEFCRCPPHTVLSEDGETCVRPDEFACTGATCKIDRTGGTYKLDNGIQLIALDQTMLTPTTLTAELVESAAPSLTSGELIPTAGLRAAIRLGPEGTSFPIQPLQVRIPKTVLGNRPSNFAVVASNGNLHPCNIIDDGDAVIVYPPRLGMLMLWEVAPSPPTGPVATLAGPPTTPSVITSWLSTQGLGFVDCADLLGWFHGLPSGYYQIDPDRAGGVPALEAYCDMKTDGGGWTVIDYAHSQTWSQHFRSWEIVGGIAIPANTEPGAPAREAWATWFKRSGSHGQYRVSPTGTDVTSYSGNAQAYAATGNFYGCRWGNDHCPCGTCVDPDLPSSGTTPGECPHLLIDDNNDAALFVPTAPNACAAGTLHRHLAPSIGVTGTFAVAYRNTQPCAPANTGDLACDAFCDSVSRPNACGCGAQWLARSNIVMGRRPAFWPDGVTGSFYDHTSSEVQYRERLLCKSQTSSAVYLKSKFINFLNANHGASANDPSMQECLRHTTGWKPTVGSFPAQIASPELTPAKRYAAAGSGCECPTDYRPTLGLLPGYPFTASDNGGHVCNDDSFIQLDAWENGQCNPSHATCSDSTLRSQGVGSCDL